ncbi:MAG: diacylglycerol kinase family protein [Chloroflexi bacterium]|nr:diacylglycerol kinase family protein [Chloroflexota bacterium]
MSYFRSRLRAFRYAFQGLAYLLRSQPNARIHATATLAVVALAAWLALPLTSWALLVLAMGLVWSAEALNTALEAAVDLASPEIHPRAKEAKDAAAAGVLLAAFAAAVVGFLVLGPPLYARLFAP